MNSLCTILVRASTACFIVAFMLTTHRRAAAQDPGSLEKLTFMMPDGPIAINFRFCPAGTMIPGTPDLTGSAQRATPIAVRSFYIDETEITVGQFRGVVGAAGIKRLVQFAMVEEKNNPQFRRAIEAGTDEPALFVGLEDAVNFCKLIQVSYDQSRLAADQVTVESRQFRLPSHTEWQYAARAISSADERPAIRHFNRWPSLSELSPANQQKCHEVWTSLVKPGQFQGSQDDFLVLSTATGAGESQKVREILEEAFSIAFKSEKRSAAGIGALRPVKQTLPNAWSIYDMHEGVTEWTIGAATADPQQTWEKLLGRSDMNGYENAFLSGGTFKDSYFTAGALSRFTFWGGSQLTDGKASLFTYSQDIVEDKAPGFRIVMDRALAKDWLYLVRKSVRKSEGRSPVEVQYLVDSERLIADLTPKDSEERQVIAFYRLLANPVFQKSEFASHLITLSKLESPTDTGEVSASATANNLNALLNKKNTATAPTSKKNVETDDQIYFRYVATRISKE